MRKRKRVRVDDRRAQILQAARELFLERGYAATSTDAIIERSGGSKAMVYAYFGNKAGLFRAVVEAAVAETRASAARSHLDPLDPERGLRRIGIATLSLWAQAGTLEIIRLVIAEGARVPDMRAFAAAERKAWTEDVIADFLRRCAEAGTLQAREPVELAEVFVGIVVQPALFSLVTGCPLARPEIERQVDRILPYFLALCRPA